MHVGGGEGVMVRGMYSQWVRSVVDREAVILVLDIDIVYVGTYM